MSHRLCTASTLPSTAANQRSRLATRGRLVEQEARRSERGATLQGSYAEKDAAIAAAAQAS
jgi:hypothetical protein